jgi:hypothetical protein
MTNDVNIQLMGAEELLKVLSNLEYKTQHKTLKKITRDIGTKVFKPGLKKAHPYQQIQKSIGVKTGRSTRVAAAFVGPRMKPYRFQTEKQKQSGTHSGWLAQIVEFNKGVNRKTAKGYNRGVMAKVGTGRMLASMKRDLPRAEKHFIKSVKTIIEREWKKFNKSRLA